MAEYLFTPILVKGISGKSHADEADFGGQKAPNPTLNRHRQVPHCYSEDAVAEQKLRKRRSTNRPCSFVHLSKSFFNTPQTHVALVAGFLAVLHLLNIQRLQKFFRDCP